MHDTYLYIYEEEVQQRNKDIIQITEDITILNDVFKSLKDVVKDQGCLIDHIEDNIEAVNNYTESAETQLLIADSKQRSKKNWLLYILVFIFIVILLIILIIILTTK